MRIKEISMRKGDQFVKISMEEFFSIPVTDRVQLLLKNGFRFFDESGQVVSIKDGLDALHVMRQGG